jgi:hypothetical protein
MPIMNATHAARPPRMSPHFAERDAIFSEEAVLMSQEKLLFFTLAFSFCEILCDSNLCLRARAARNS